MTGTVTYLTDSQVRLEFRAWDGKHVGDLSILRSRTNLSREEFLAEFGSVGSTVEGYAPNPFVMSMTDFVDRLRKQTPEEQAEWKARVEAWNECKRLKAGIV